MIKKLNEHLDLKYKTMLIMGIFICVVVSVFIMIFSRTYYRYEEKVFGEESLNTLHTLDTSIQAFLKNADYYSKMVISDSTVQEQMALGDLTIDTIGRQKVIQKVNSVLQFSEAADEIWLIDMSGKTLKIGGYTSLTDKKNIADYENLRTPYGRAEIRLIVGEKNGEISLVRSYNSTSDFSSIGIIGVGISEKNFRNTISKTVDITKEKLLILDDENRVIFWSDENVDSSKEYIELILDKEFDEKGLLEVVRLGRNRVFLSGIECANRGWKIIRFTPLPITSSSYELLRLNIIMVIFIGLIMIIGAAVMTRVLAQPSQIMLRAMSTAQDGVPQKISEKATLKEFVLLYNGYNSMVERISQLIDETIERQKRIRQVELNEIQEQMKPHFLYNTLESVEALAMMGDTEKVCQVIEALGDFYRKSVSGGREFLTIEEEIRIAKDYIQIMEIRFGDSFNTEIKCDTRCLDYMIPKLTIQPLVENAFQHGVRTKNNHGDVYVNVSLEEYNIHISVEDSGDGVPDEIVNEIAGDKKPVRGKSLGLRGTIERLRLVYGDSFRYEISRNPSKIELFINVGNLLVDGDE